MSIGLLMSSGLVEYIAGRAVGLSRCWLEGIGCCVLPLFNEASVVVDDSCCTWDPPSV